MKKFLSLVLALVMTMSLVTISAGAKDFTDADKVNYDEAIAVLSAVKVIDGYTDGSFKPQTPLNRGQAAKIICNLVLGPTTAAELSATVAPFSDVPANNIFAGYITYCANEGIICGYGDGTFRPTGSLTGYAFMKMLLGALGYDAEIEGYNNPGSFGIQVAKQAIGIGLNKGLKDTFNGNKTVTREEACLYALNTLKATMVEYDQKIIANVNGAQVTVGTSLAKEVKWNIAEKKNDGNIRLDGYVQFAEKYFPKLELETGHGIYGRPTNVWKNKKSEIGAFTSIEPTYVYTDKTEQKDVYKDLGKDVVEDYTWEAYINGELQVDNQNNLKLEMPKKNSTDKWEYTGKGAVVEVYVEDYPAADKDDPEGAVTVCEINYYLGQVTGVKTDDDGEYINVKALSSEPKLDDRTFYVEGYEKDDYVVFTVDYNDDKDFVIGEVMEPETVTGEVSRVQNDSSNKTSGNTDAYVQLNGESDKYYYTMLGTHMVYDVSDTTWNKHPELNKEYILYMTPEGYVLGFEPAEDVVDQYLYVQDSDEELRDWVAKVVLADATNPKVDLKDGLKKVPGNATIPGTNTKIGDKIRWIDLTENKDEATNIDKLIWKYTVNDKGVYTLTYVDAAYPTELFEINNGKSYINAVDDSTDVLVDQKTVFVDVKGEKAYTGYDEVPNISNAEIVYVKSKGVAKIVFVLDGDIYDKDSTYFMLTSDSRKSLKYTVDGEEYWEYEDAFVNGHKETLTIGYDAVEKLLGDAQARLSVGVLYKAVKTIDEKYITELEKVALDNFDVVAVGAEAFRIQNGQTVNKQKFDTDDETVFVLVELLPEDMKAYRAAVKAHTNYTGKWEYTISEGDIDDMFVDKDDEGFKTYVTVVEQSKQNADLVYIVYTADGKLTAKEPGVRTITVDNVNVTADTTKAAADKDVTVTVTAKPGYTITDIECAQASKINVTTGEVTIPAGDKNIVINVETVGHEYTLDTDSHYWNIKVTDAKGNAVNGKVTVGETYTVVATAKYKDDDHNGARAFFLDGKKASDATLKTEGKYPVKETITINNATELKLCQKLAADGKVYQPDSNSELHATDIPATSPVPNCWYYTDLGTAAVLTGSFTVAYDADGALRLGINTVA